MSFFFAWARFPLTKFCAKTLNIATNHYYQLTFHLINNLIQTGKIGKKILAGNVKIQILSNTVMEGIAFMSKQFLFTIFKIMEKKVKI